MQNHIVAGGGGRHRFQQQRIFRAGGYTGTAAVTVLITDFRRCQSVDSGSKSDRLLAADIGTGLTNDTLFSETAILHSQAQLPDRLDFAIEDRLGAGAHTFAAKSAFATMKVDLRISTGPTDDDALRASADASVARGASVSELRLTDCSGRPDRTRGHRGSPAEQVSPGVVHRLIHVRSGAGRPKNKLK